MLEKPRNQPKKPEELTNQDVCADCGVVRRFICNHRDKIAFILGAIVASVTSGVAVRLLKQPDYSDVFVSNLIQRIEQLRGDTTKGVFPAFVQYDFDDKKLNVDILGMPESQEPLPPKVPQCPVDDEEDALRI